MRKLIILICIAITGGALYALVPNLFPDTPSFPRTPTADGTIGGVLQKIVGGIISDATDGTVANTEKLDGVTATWYLKNTTCSATDKWIGIDANGKAICGTSSPILADYGTVSEQGCPANIYHATGTNGTTNTGDTLKSWDIIKTWACGLTIAFTDFSILRLDADTTVSLDVLAAPAPSTQTIASAILSNGSLWGRILTDTGSYSIGTDKIVAWVRGTSVAVVQTGVTITMGSYSSTTGKWPMTKVGTPSTPFLAIPHSRSSNNTLTSSVTSWPLPQIQVSPSITGPWLVNTPRILLDTIFAESPWIRSNTRKDLIYISALALTGQTAITDVDNMSTSTIASSPPESKRAYDEYMATEPSKLPGTNLDSVCEPWYAYWTSLAGTMYERCQPSTLIAFADYTKGDKKMYSSGFTTNILFDQGRPYYLLNNIQPYKTTVQWTSPSTLISLYANMSDFMNENNAIDITINTSPQLNSFPIIYLFNTGAIQSIRITKY